MKRSPVLFVLLAGLAVAGVCRADVSSLRYNRFGRLRTTRLQRQEAADPQAATPYPAAGYRPDRQFDFPVALQPQSQQLAPERPGLTYVSPAVASSPARLRQFSPARLRQFSPARQQSEPQPQQTYAAPQGFYAAPEPEEQAEQLDEPQPQPLAQSQSQRLTARKSARLSANREDREDDDAETVSVSDIEGDSKVDTRKAVAPQPTGTVAYYPAGAVSFVHPYAAYFQPTAGLFAPQPAVQPAVQPATAPANPTVVAAAALKAPASGTFASPVASQQLVQPQFVQQQLVQPQPQLFSSPFAQFAYTAGQLRAW